MGKKIVLSGGPHTGKTTLMEGLRRGLPHIHFVPEPAEQIITAELAKQRQQPGYEGIFPTTRYSDFVHLVVARSVELEAEIPEESSKAVLDRSLIDNIGYARLNGHDHLIPDIQRRVRTANYTAALLCDFVGTYTQTPVRPETEEFAHAIHDHLVVAYRESGIPVITIPALDVERRLGMAIEVIEGI